MVKSSAVYGRMTVRHRGLMQQIYLLVAEFVGISFLRVFFDVNIFTRHLNPSRVQRDGYGRIENGSCNNQVGKCEEEI